MRMRKHCARALQCIWNETLLLLSLLHLDAPLATQIVVCLSTSRGTSCYQSMKDPDLFNICFVHVYDFWIILLTQAWHYCVTRRSLPTGIEQCQSVISDTHARSIARKLWSLCVGVAGSVTLFGELTKPPRTRQAYFKPQIGYELY